MKLLVFALALFFCPRQSVFAQSATTDFLSSYHATDSVQHYFSKADPADTLPVWMNLQSCIPDPDRQGNFFSRTNASNAYSFGWRSPVPGGTGIKAVKCSVKIRIRASDMAGDCKLVYSIAKKENDVHWEGREIKNRLKGANAWTELTDEFILPAGYTNYDHQLSCYIWNNSSTVIDLDEFGISFTTIDNISFLPQLPTTERVAEGEFREIYKGSKFAIAYDKVNGSLNLIDKNGQVIWDRVMLYKKRTIPGSRAMEIPWSSYLLYEGDAPSDDGRVYRFSFRRAPVNQLQLIVSRDGNSLKIRFESKPGKASVLERQSLAFHYRVPPSRIMRVRGFEDRVNLQEEYWLGKEGAAWRSEAAEWWLYHPGKVSSLQYSSVNNVLWVNADLAEDHPLLYWPALKKSYNRKSDRSSSHYGEEDTISCEFTLFRSEDDLVMPRFLPAPYGYDGVFIWTEHADYADIRTHKAVYFGDEYLNAPSEAVGGFSGHKIPVTKSVFYANPDRVKNTEKAGFVQSEISSVRSTTGFSDFLKMLHADGSEIAIHTPEHFTTTRTMMEESLRFMADSFSTVTWIDHGYDNSPQSNREDIVCDGLLKTSPHYALDLFGKYGVRYVWNCYYEDTGVFRNAEFNSELMIPHPAFGDARPAPDFWKHLTASGELLHFRTTGTLDPENGGWWNYFLAQKRLDFLAENRGVYFAHVYPARIDSSNGFYIWRDGHFRVDPEFDKALERLSRCRDQRKLYLTTVRDYLHYREQLDKVVYSTDENGFAVVSNYSTEDIRGLTMAISSHDVSLSGAAVERKKTDDGLVFWFDLPAGQSVTIKPVMEH